MMDEIIFVMEVWSFFIYVQKGLIKDIKVDAMSDEGGFVYKQLIAFLIIIIVVIKA